MDGSGKSMLARPIFVAGVCTLFMAVGPALMVLNKEILDSVGFRYPLLVSCLGLAFAAIATHAMHLLGYLELKHRHVVDFKFWYTRCLPVGICHAATLSFGNAQYLYTGMAMIQFLKSFTPIVTATFSFFIQGKMETRAQAFALILICFGRQDSQVPVCATVSVWVAFWRDILHLIYSAVTPCRGGGQGHKMDVLESTYYLAPAGATCLFLTGCVVEGPTVLAKGHLYKLALYPMTFFFAASLGLGVQLLTTMVIKATSATSLKVLSQVRNAIPVLYGALVYQELIGAQSAFGYVLSVAAFGWYTYLKMQPQTRPKTDDGQALKEIEVAPLIIGGGSGAAASAGGEEGATGDSKAE